MQALETTVAERGRQAHAQLTHMTTRAASEHYTWAAFQLERRREALLVGELAVAPGDPAPALGVAIEVWRLTQRQRRRQLELREALAEAARAEAEEAEA
eukprot:8871325-Pyramimonas_sp.AAC.2